MTEQLHEISHLIEPSIIWNHFCRGMLFTKIIHEHCCHETFGHSRNDFCYRRLRPINTLVVQFIHLKNISTGVFTNETF